MKQPLAGIRIKLFFSFLLIICISYSSLLFITINSVDTSLENNSEPVQAPDRTFSREYKSLGTRHAFPSVYISREELASIREKTFEHIMVSAAFGILLSFALAYLLARKLTGPARELSLGAERIEVGDFAHRVNVAASDEFGSLAASFNKMAEALEEREITIKRKTLDLEILNRSLHELNEKLEIKVAERTAALETGKGRLEAILTSMAEGVLVTDQENRIILFNPSAQRIFDMSPHKALGQHIDQVCSLGGFCQLLEFIREIQNGDYLSEGREEHLEIKGKKLKVNMSPLLDKSWEFAGVVMSIRDVTLEEEIDRMKTEFISTVSHELKTPLTSIKGSLQIILRRSSELHDTERELLIVCQRNTDRLIRLISDILDISRIESGSIDFNFKPESVGRIVSEAIEEMTGFASEHYITLIDTAGCDLPPVFADCDRLLQVMTNLLSNAIKFSPEGQTVTVETERIGDFVAVSIIDNGLIIRKTERNKLFRKFQRLGGNEPDERGGTGLGLAICKEIIEKHHGRIYYRSRMGGGNIFTFTVPVYGKVYEQ